MSYEMPPSYKPPKVTPTPAGVGGSYGSQISMFLIFYNEINRMFDAVNPPIFDMGYITEIIGTKNFKYKVKLENLGSVVTATGADTTSATFSWSKPASMYLKGALALVLCTPSSRTKQNATVSYSIVSVRQTGAFAPKVSEYPV